MQCRFEDYLLLDGNMQQSFCPKLLLSCLVLLGQDVCKRGARYTCNTVDMRSMRLTWNLRLVAFTSSLYMPVNRTSSNGNSAAMSRFIT